MHLNLNPLVNVIMRYLTVFLAFILITGCDSAKDDGIDPTLTATTVFTSSSLSTGKNVSAAKSDGVNLYITPGNVAGDAVSLLFAIAGVPDEGIVVFGDARPDIAPATASTFAFDFRSSLPIVSTPSWDTSRPGGQSEHMAVIIAHFDAEFSADGTPYTARFALVSNNGMQRGDKLLDTGSGFQWYDLDAGAFTSTRPSNPARITDIESFSDPIRPQMVFYPFNVFMTNPPLSLLTVDLLSASGLDVVLNFDVNDLLALEGVTSDVGMTAADVVTALTLTQALDGFGNSGFEVDASATIIP